jgi:putative transposase
MDQKEIRFMGKKRHTVETIVAKLREADVMIGKGQTTEEAIRQLGISDATYYKWQEVISSRPFSW